MKDLFASPRLVDRMIAAGWIKIIRKGKPGRETLYDYNSAACSFQRLKNGDEPPPLPCNKEEDGGLS